MFRVTLRTAEEKADLEVSWARPDEDFFGAGACHVLAGAFLRAYPDAGFHALHIQPASGFRGGHVVVTNGAWIFDCRGWNRNAGFLNNYEQALRALQPGWSCALHVVDDPIGWDFCRAHRHRHPSQFARDPVARAALFLERFPGPSAAHS